MGVEKMSLSFDLDLGEAIRTSAAARSQSVSAWVAEAARARLRNEALADALAAWGERFGPLEESEIQEADQVLQEARTKAPKAPPVGAKPRGRRRKEAAGTNR